MVFACSHENISGYYRVSAFFVAKIFSDMLPMRLVPLLVYVCITYFMVGKSLTQNDKNPAPFKLVPPVPRGATDGALGASVRVNWVLYSHVTRCILPISADLLLGAGFPATRL